MSVRPWDVGGVYEALQELTLTRSIPFNNVPVMKSLVVMPLCLSFSETGEGKVLILSLNWMYRVLSLKNETLRERKTETQGRSAE